MDIASIQNQIGSLPPDRQHEILELLNELSDARVRQEASKDFLAFVREAWPAFIEGNHHRVMADAFNRIASGELKRLLGI